jgi:hypothetical protein
MTTGWVLSRSVTARSNCFSRAARPVALRSQLARLSLSNSITRLPLRCTCTARTSPAGVVSLWILRSASFILFALSRLEEFGGKGEWPGFGSSRICLARMDALATAWSTDGGRCAAAMELYERVCWVVPGGEGGGGLLMAVERGGGRVWCGAVMLFWAVSCSERVLSQF